MCHRRRTKRERTITIEWGAHLFTVVDILLLRHPLQRLLPRKALLERAHNVRDVARGHAVAERLREGLDLLAAPFAAGRQGHRRLCALVRGLGVQHGWQEKQQRLLARRACLSNLLKRSFLPPVRRPLGCMQGKGVERLLRQQQPSPS